MTQLKLLDQVRDALRVRHYSIRTEETYVQWIKRYILFHHKTHPRDLAEADISAFLTDLASTRMSQPRPKIKPCPPCYFSTSRCWGLSWSG